MPHSISALVGAVLYSIACLMALRFGGRPERLTAAMLIAQLVACNVTHSTAPDAFQLGAFVSDVLLCAGLFYLLLTEQRRWLLWASAYQALACLAHMARWLDPSLDGWTYLTVSIFFGYGVVLALSIGVAGHMWQRTRAHHGR